MKAKLNWGKELTPDWGKEQTLKSTEKKKRTQNVKKMKPNIKNSINILSFLLSGCSKDTELYKLVIIIMYC